ncbi:PAS domain S-box protein [Methanospirillum purgamenti]|uniref:PAS domain S-box protein n=2 Tax=Methanospirillum TaxID=2202 RepID=A0A8F5VPP0_METHU|nr:PAS domain S-box protein [Methanospirillum hungatei]
MKLDLVTNLKKSGHILLFILIYFIFAKISMFFGISYGNVSPFWIPAGIAVSAILFSRIYLLPGVFFGTVFSVATTGVTLPVAISLGIGNFLAISVFCLSFQHLIKEKMFLSSPGLIFKFCIISAGSSLIAAGIGVSSLILSGYVQVPDILINSLTWWLGDVAGMLIIAPVIFTWSTLTKASLATYIRIEHVFFYFLLIIGSMLIFSYSTPYVFLIFVIYAAFRFSARHGTLTVLIGDLIAIWSVYFSQSVFFGSSVHDTLFSIQSFITITSITGLFLISALHERKKVMNELQAAKRELEDRVANQSLTIRERETRFSELVNAMRSGVVVYRPTHDETDFIIEEVNPAVEKIEGLKREDIVGRSVKDVFPGVENFGLFQVFQEVSKTGITKHFPVSYYVDNRHSGWRDNFVFKLPGGEIVAVYEDVTEEKEVKKELVYAKNWLEFTQTVAKIGLWTWDIQSDTLTWSDEFFVMFGLPPGTIPSFDSWLKTIHPDDRDAAYERTLRSVSEKKELWNEYRIILPSGEIRWIAAAGRTEYDHYGVGIGMSGVCIDITSRKDIENALRESEERYRMLVDNVPDIILVHRNGVLLYVNPAAASMMGYTIQELYDTLLIFHVSPEYHGILIDAIKRRMDSQDIEPYELEILSKSGERKRVVVRGCTIQYQGEPASLNVLTDITERKIIEDQLRDFNEKLEIEVKNRTEELQTSLAEKEVLLKEIHHRVKNNMQVISSLLFMQARNAEQKEVRDILLESQNRIKSIALVHEKLYQSKDFDRIDYPDYLIRITKQIAESYKAGQNQVRIIVNNDTVYLSIDKAVPCSLIVSELVSNSLKYAFPDNRPGEIQIDFSLLENEYELIYTDNGIGIPESIEPGKTKTLGLELIQGLVHQLNGTMTLDRSNGTKYTLRFSA